MNMIRYADKTLLIADSEEKLQRITKRLDAVGEQLGMKINETNTECMVMSKSSALTCNISKENAIIQQLSMLNYLGIILKEIIRCENEIK